MTKYSLAEQVRRILNGGDPSAPSLKIEEIIPAINQVINRKLKLDILSVYLPSGETIPDGSMIASYDSRAVSTYKDRARVALPAIPVSLPMGMGVFHVGPAGRPSEFFIPIPVGQGALLSTQPLINELLGRVGYEVYDGYVVFAKDITLAPTSITSVDIKLIVSDTSKYSIYDMLPIPSDYEADVIQEVVKLFSVEPPQDNLTDSSNDSQKIKQ